MGFDYPVRAGRLSRAKASVMYSEIWSLIQLGRGMIRAERNTANRIDRARGRMIYTERVYQSPSAYVFMLLTFRGRGSLSEPR